MISERKARKILSQFFRHIKVSKKIYLPVVDGLIETSLRGVDSHGIRLAPHYIRAALLGRINPAPKIIIKKTSGSTILMDADHTYGITAGTIAMRYAITTARKNGVGVVVVKNSSHFGAAAIYTLMAARHNMIGQAMTPVEDLVVPFGGSKPFLGTNAYSYAAPVQGEGPLILDMATSYINKNKLMMYQKENKILEAGWAVDKDGKLTQDPKKAVALTHFGGFKGYGMALKVEIFTSILSGMPYGPHITHMFPLTKEKRNLSHYFEVIDISKLQSVSSFKRRLKGMIDEIRNIPPSPGFKQVMVPGDPEKEIYKKRKKNGIPLTSEIVEDFQNLATGLGMEITL